MLVHILAGIAEYLTTDSASDQLYDVIDEMLLAGKFSRLNAALQDLSVRQLPVELLLVILTATLPARSRLPARAGLLEKIYQELASRGDDPQALLRGL